MKGELQGMNCFNYCLLPGVHSARIRTRCAPSRALMPLIALMLRARNRHVGAVVDVGYSLIAYLRRPTVFTNAAGAAVPDVIVSVRPVVTGRSSIACIR